MSNWSEPAYACRNCGGYWDWYFLNAYGYCAECHAKLWPGEPWKEPTSRPLAHE